MNTATQTNRSIKEVLVQAGLLTPAQFERLRQTWQASGEEGQPPSQSLFDYLIEHSGLPRTEFLQRLAKALNWPFLPKIPVPHGDDPTVRQERQKLMELLSPKLAFQYHVIPIRMEEGQIYYAVSDPFDPTMLQAVLFNATHPPLFALADRDEIDKALNVMYGLGAEMLEGVARDEEESSETAEKDIDTSDQEASVIKFVNKVILEAYKSRATDIHFEPQEHELRIRYRIDGMLYKAPMPEHLKNYQSAIISRIKVMAKMNIAERRLPQDGRINVRIEGKEIDIRVSTVPTVYGESVSLRLLTRDRQKITLTELGYPERERAAVEQIINKPHGIFLVTGPTGSGKSTTLYACLQQINHPTKRIITIEDPVEYEIEGINQIPIRPEIGLTFATGLRHILRQDPNVIMVGEIRDLETAEIAIRAALTGHLVFSTLHTNDAPSAFTRLIDMGIEPFLVASSVEAVLAQRLVRLVCPECRKEQEFDYAYLRSKQFPFDIFPNPKFYRGEGCEACRFLGYQGRTGIYELLIVTEDIRHLIMNRAPASEIRERAVAAGMKTLRQAGWYRTQDPERPTTVEEVLRVTQTEEHLAALMEDETLSHRVRSSQTAAFQPTRELHE